MSGGCDNTDKRYTARYGDLFASNMKVSAVNILETSRLSIRQLTTEDAEFMLELVNDPSYLRYIGDRGVRTLDDARRHILDGPCTSYERFGFGLWLAELKTEGRPIGICGLIKRDTLEDIDIGFALLPRFRRNGYTFEAASAVMDYGRNILKLQRVVAITALDNDASIHVLSKLGFVFERLIRLSQDDKELKLFSIDI